MFLELGFRLIGRISAAAILFVALPAAANDAATIDRLELQALLEQKRFDELNAKLAEYQRSFERGERGDFGIDAALSAFATTRPGVIEQLDLWVESHPDSEFPYLARSRYHRHNGFIARGESSIAETSPEQLDAMRHHFDMAAADATRAVAINPLATAGYAELIAMAASRSKQAANDRLVKIALDAARSSELIRARHLANLTPWWGGSLREIRAFVKQTKRRISASDQGHPLDGYEHYVRGLMAIRNDNRLDAVAHFDKALEFGEAVIYRLARARNSMAMQKDDAGRADFERSLQLEPHNPRLLSAAASFYAARQDYKRAEELWELALELDPLNPSILGERAYHRSKAARFKEAREDLDRSLVLGSHYHDNRFQRGRLNLLWLGDRERARDDFAVATTVAPDRAEYWYHFAQALTAGPDSELPECKALEAFERYVELCHGQGQCNQDRLLTAVHFTTERAKAYGSC